MTRDEMLQFCQRHGLDPNGRSLGKQAPSETDKLRAADETSGQIVRELTAAGVDTKLKMDKREAVAVMQKGLQNYAKRELQRMQTTQYLAQRNFDNLPEVELRDAPVFTGEPQIHLPGSGGGGGRRR